MQIPWSETGSEPTLLEGRRQHDTRSVVPVGECLVSFNDTGGVHPSVTVQASRVLEAALSTRRSSIWE